MKRRLISSILLTSTLITTLPICALADEQEYYWLEVGSNEWMYKEGDSFATGWLQVGDKWYYFNSDGHMAHDTTIDGYILGSDGAWENNTPSNNTTATSVSKKPSKERIEIAPDFSWFQENGNTYFKLTEKDYSTGKIDDEPYISGLWNIDDSLYYFDENGVLQKGEVTISGEKYLFGSDGKYIKCISNEKANLFCAGGITTKSTTANTKVDFSYDEFKTPKMNEMQKFLGDSYLNNKPKPTSTERTLNCYTGQTIRLMDFLIYTTDYKTVTKTYANGNSGTDSFGLTLLPNLVVNSNSSDSDVATLGVRLYSVDGAMRGIIPYVIAKKTGEATITLDVNGTKTSLDVNITE
jgi:hypothetical protein